MNMIMWFLIGMWCSFGIMAYTIDGKPAQQIEGDWYYHAHNVAMLMWMYLLVGATACYIAMACIIEASDGI